jgi:hypothetical protein
MTLRRRRADAQEQVHGLVDGEDPAGGDALARRRWPALPVPSRRRCAALPSLGMAARALASWRKPLRNRVEDLLGVGPFIAVELGVDHLVVEGDLEGRPSPALQLDADVAREPVGDRLPETSGLGEVVSNRAVLDRDHADSGVWGGDGLASPGVAARSPALAHSFRSATSSPAMT